MNDAPNTLILCADQLSPKAPGYAGHGMARTPHLDELAEGGTVFADAVCLSPICVPSRAAMATGRYVHEIGTWDNGHAYTGTEAPSWGHMLQSDREVTTIGKLHYRDESPQTGFPSQIVPMHAEGGVGDTFSLLRDDIQPRPELRTMVAGAHAGESTYLDYDETVTNETTTWLRGHAVDPRPWTTFVSHVSPHHPLVAPPDIAATYPPDEVPLPYDWRLEDQPHHPALDRFRGYYGMSGEFSEAEVRRARATYFAMVTYLDDQIGRILEELTATGLDTRTHVIFTADHGDNVGDHGLWWKNNMYANSVGVPLILRGPGVEAGKVCRTPVSHLDVFATILELAGHPVPSWCRGRNLLTIASEPDDPTRLVFSEYHATGSSSGIFMVADSSYRLIEYVGEPSQLFDRRNDPDERHDLAGDPAYASVLAHYDRMLREICNPEDVDRNAKSDQRAAIAALGGSEAVRALGYRTHVPVPGTT